MRLPATAPLVIAGYLSACYLAILIFDVLGLWEVHAWLAMHANQPFVWWYLFAEKGSTEVLQWIFLALTAVHAGILSARLKDSGEHSAARFWMLISVTGGALLIEDSASLRYILALAVTASIYGGGGSIVHPVGTMVEGVYYAMIASIPIYAFLRYRHLVWNSPSRGWLLAGYAMYAMAAIGSVTRYLGLYNTIGEGLNAASGGVLFEGYVPHSVSNPEPGRLFMDLVVEESLELMGAVLLLAAVLAYARDFQRSR